MEKPQRDSGLSESGDSNIGWWPSGFTEKLHSLALTSKEESSGAASTSTSHHGEPSFQAASQAFWETGRYSGKIPNGFYSIIPDRKLKALFDTIPPLDELFSLGLAGSGAEIILVDAEKDKKLSMLKQWSAALGKGLQSNPASVIKKLAELVYGFYKQQFSDPSPAKTSLEEVPQLLETKGILLGQIRHGSCRPRAILFKVLADAVGLESELMVGIPSDGTVECADSHKHLSVVVVRNSVVLLVDLVRFPGQLVPFSPKAFYVSHISVEGESDSAENDSCDSPLEPNSPLCGASERGEASPALGSSRSKMLQSTVFAEGKLSCSSHSEPNITNTLWRRSRRKAVIEQRTASSSPEHPMHRARGRSMLSGDRQSFRGYADGVAVSRSDGASTADTRRIRRRSISVTPEIGDDIVRAVRAMNETLKQSHISKNKGHEDLRCTAEKRTCGVPSNSGQICASHGNLRNQLNLCVEQKSVSLPSSPHEFRGEISERNRQSNLSTRSFFSTWNKVLQSSPFHNQPLLPFEEWNIDFAELTVGTRVGIGFFGEVFRGIWNGTDVAIKVFLEQDLTAENMEDFCNEISILSRLRHPNVILFLGACMKPPHLSMVTEYMEMGSLYYLIHASGQKHKLSWRRRLKMLRDICRGLMCIHRMKIVHRDLKSANCLVDRHWTVKICDFGLSRVMTDAPLGDSSSAGTPEWMAPELIRNEPFTEKCDIFSLGVIIWELCTLSRPWEGVPPVQVVYAVAHEGTRLDIPEGPLGKLIADCWAEPEDRPSCQEILNRLLECEYTLR